MEESAREFDQLQLTPAERAQEHAEIDRAASELSPWQAEQVEVGSRIRMLELELIARRIKEWSQDEAASALAKPQALSKPAIADVLSKYRSPLKVAIAEQLLNIRRPTYLLVCRGLDKHDRDKLPPGWTKNTNYSLFVQVFTDSLESIWSRVRFRGMDRPAPLESTAPSKSPCLVFFLLTGYLPQQVATVRQSRDQSRSVASLRAILTDSYN